MKARIVPEPRAVLAWGLAPGDDEYDALARLCGEYRAALVTADASQAGRTVGALLGLRGAGAAAEAGADVPPDCPAAILLSGFGRGEVEPFVDALAARGVSVPLRGLLTVHNRGWTLARLLREFMRERAAWEGKA